MMCECQSLQLAFKTLINKRSAKEADIRAIIKSSDIAKKINEKFSFQIKT